MNKAAIIGVPLDLGANRRGVEMGPSGLRVTNLAERIRQLGCDVVDRGDIDVPLPEECDICDAKMKFAEDIKDVCEDVEEPRGQQGARSGRRQPSRAGESARAT